MLLVTTMCNIMKCLQLQPTLRQNVLEDDKMLQKGLAGKGLILSTFLLLFVNKVMFIKCFFSAPKVFGSFC